VSSAGVRGFKMRREVAAGALAQHAAAREAVKANKCPRCGRGVRHAGIRGLYRCEQFATPEVPRKDANAPACEWQGFTG